MIRRLVPLASLALLSLLAVGCPPEPPPAVVAKPLKGTPSPKQTPLSSKNGLVRASAPTLDRIEWPGTADGADLLGVAMLGTSQTIAVGVPGAVWIGAQKSVTIAPFPDGITDAIWSDGPAFAIAVGYGGVSYQWNGKTWSALSTGVDTDLHAIWGRANGKSREIYAGGAKGTILSFDGSAWKKMTAPENVTISAFAGYGDKLWAVGQTGGEPPDGAILALDGDAWKDVCKDLACGNAIYAAFATGPADLWTGGAGGELVHYANGQPELLRSGTRGAITAINGTGVRDIFVAGDGGFLLWWNGKTWSPLASGDEDLRAMTMLPSGEGWIVGTSGAIRHVPKPAPASGS